MKLRWLVLILPVFWIGCEDEKEEESCANIEVCCESEITAMDTASDAFEDANPANEDEWTGAIATVCTAINDVIKCVKDNGDPDGDLSEMEEVYDEMCTEP